LPATAQEQAAGLSGANYEGDVFRDVVSEYHKAVIKGYLFLVDEETIRTGLVMIVLFDDCGRVVRQRRIPPSECNWISGSWFLRSFFDLDHFLEADPGPAYQVGGICGPPFAHDDVAMTEAERELIALDVTSQ
jgi:hypothetical protein